MQDARDNHGTLSFHAESRLIRLIDKEFPGSADIGYFREERVDNHGAHTFGWIFDMHRILAIRPLWQTNRLLIRQTLTVDGKTGAVSIPIRWGGLTILFDKDGEAVLEGDAAHDFWKALIERDGKGAPKP